MKWLWANSIGSPNAGGIDSVHLAIRASEMDWNNEINDVEVSRSREISPADA
jgi:hypothetical protein